MTENIYYWSDESDLVSQVLSLIDQEPNIPECSENLFSQNNTNIGLIDFDSFYGADSCSDTTISSQGNEILFYNSFLELSEKYTSTSPATALDLFWSIVDENLLPSLPFAILPPRIQELILTDPDGYARHDDFFETGATLWQDWNPSMDFSKTDLRLASFPAHFLSSLPSVQSLFFQLEGLSLEARTRIENPSDNDPPTFKLLAQILNEYLIKNEFSFALTWFDWSTQVSLWNKTAGSGEQINSYESWIVLQKIWSENSWFFEWGINTELGIAGWIMKWTGPKAALPWMATRIDLAKDDRVITSQSLAKYLKDPTSFETPALADADNGECLDEPSNFQLRNFLQSTRLVANQGYQVSLIPALLSIEVKQGATVNMGTSMQDGIVSIDSGNPLLTSQGIFLKFGLPGISADMELKEISRRQGRLVGTIHVHAADQSVMRIRQKGVLDGFEWIFYDSPWYDYVGLDFTDLAYEKTKKADSQLAALFFEKREGRVYVKPSVSDSDLNELVTLVLNLPAREPELLTKTAQFVSKKFKQQVSPSQYTNVDFQTSVDRIDLRIPYLEKTNAYFRIDDLHIKEGMIETHGTFPKISARGILPLHLVGAVIGLDGALHPLDSNLEVRFYADYESKRIRFVLSGPLPIAFFGVEGESQTEFILDSQFPDQGLENFDFKSLLQALPIQLEASLAQQSDEWAQIYLNGTVGYQDQISGNLSSRLHVSTPNLNVDFENLSLAATANGVVSSIEDLKGQIDLLKLASRDGALSIVEDEDGNFHVKARKIFSGKTSLSGNHYQVQADFLSGEIIIQPDFTHHKARVTFDNFAVDINRTQIKFPDGSVRAVSGFILHGSWEVNGVDSFGEIFKKKKWEGEGELTVQFDPTTVNYHNTAGTQVVEANLGEISVQLGNLNFDEAKNLETTAQIDIARSSFVLKINGVSLQSSIEGYSLFEGPMVVGQPESNPPEVDVEKVGLADIGNAIIPYEPEPLHDANPNLSPPKKPEGAFNFSWMLTHYLDDALFLSEQVQDLSGSFQGLFLGAGETAVPVVKRDRAYLKSKLNDFFNIYLEPGTRIDEGSTIEVEDGKINTLHLLLNRSVYVGPIRIDGLELVTRNCLKQRVRRETLQVPFSEIVDVSWSGGKKALVEIRYANLENMGNEARQIYLKDLFSQKNWVNNPHLKILEIDGTSVDQVRPEMAFENVRLALFTSDIQDVSVGLYPGGSPYDEVVSLTLADGDIVKILLSGYGLISRSPEEQIEIVKVVVSGEGSRETNAYRILEINGVEAKDIDSDFVMDQFIQDVSHQELVDTALMPTAEKVFVDLKIPNDQENGFEQRRAVLLVENHNLAHIKNVSQRQKILDQLIVQEKFVIISFDGAAFQYPPSDEGKKIIEKIKNSKIVRHTLDTENIYLKGRHDLVVKTCLGDFNVLRLLSGFNSCEFYEYLEKEHHLKLPRNSVPLEVDQFVLFIGELAKWLGQRKENENDLPISLLVSSETRFHVDGQAELKAGSARYGDFELYVDQDDDRRNFGFSLDVIPYAMEGSSEFHPEIHGSFAANPQEHIESVRLKMQSPVDTSLTINQVAQVHFDWAQDNWNVSFIHSDIEFDEFLNKDADGHDIFHIRSNGQIKGDAHFNGYVDSTGRHVHSYFNLHPLRPDQNPDEVAATMGPGFMEFTSGEADATRTGQAQWTDMTVEGGVIDVTTRYFPDGEGKGEIETMDVKLALSHQSHPETGAALALNMGSSAQLVFNVLDGTNVTVEAVQNAGEDYPRIDYKGMVVAEMRWPFDSRLVEFMETGVNIKGFDLGLQIGRDSKIRLEGPANIFLHGPEGGIKKWTLNDFNNPQLNVIISGPIVVPVTNAEGQRAYFKMDQMKVSLKDFAVLMMGEKENGEKETPRLETLALEHAMASGMVYGSLPYQHHEVAPLPEEGAPWQMHMGEITVVGDPRHSLELTEMSGKYEDFVLVVKNPDGTDMFHLNASGSLAKGGTITGQWQIDYQIFNILGGLLMGRYGGELSTSSSDE